jgi:hypothetical protein
MIIINTVIVNSPIKRLIYSFHWIPNILDSQLFYLKKRIIFSFSFPGFRQVLNTSVAASISVLV